MTVEVDHTGLKCAVLPKRLTAVPPSGEGRVLAGITEDISEGKTMTPQDRLESPPHLNARHQHTYEAISSPGGSQPGVARHPVAARSLGRRGRGRNGTLKVTRNGQTVVLHVPKHKDVTTVDDLVAIRRFLEQSAAKTIPSPIARGFTCSSSSTTTRRKSTAPVPRPVPQQIVPYDPHGLTGTYGPKTRDRRQTAAGAKSYLRSHRRNPAGRGRNLDLGSGTGESTPWSSCWPK